VHPLPIGHAVRLQEIQFPVLGGESEISYDGPVQHLADQGRFLVGGLLEQSGLQIFIFGAVHLPEKHDGIAVHLLLEFSVISKL
jgi:hypothetical protein